MKGDESTASLLVIGGTSDIGRAAALAYAKTGRRIMLAARDLAAARRNADDIAARTGVPVSLHLLDLLDTERFETFVDGLPSLPDTVLCVAGDLGEQRRAESDIGHAQRIIRVNFEGPALILGLFAERFAARGSGTLIGVGSVAGDRGRASNYVYGAAKAGFSAFLSGLRNRLSPAGVRVITVKPGFVRTRMTEGMKLPPLLTAEPEEVGRAVLDAERGGSDVVYVRRIWRGVMAMIRLIPEPLFKRLEL